MLVIRTEQLRALESQADRGNATALQAWADRCCPHLRAQLGDEALDRHVATALQLSRELRIGTVEAAGDVLRLVVGLGRDFHQHPQIAELLAQDHLIRDQRPGLVLAMKSLEQWRRELAGTGDGDEPAPA